MSQKPLIFQPIPKGKCPYCNKYISWGDGLVQDEMWYHEHCLTRKMIKRNNALEEKLRAKTITLEEAEELDDIRICLHNIKKDPAIPLSPFMERNVPQFQKPEKAKIYREKVFSVPNRPALLSGNYTEEIQYGPGMVIENTEPVVDPMEVMKKRDELEEHKYIELKPKIKLLVGGIK